MPASYSEAPHSVIEVAYSVMKEYYPELEDAVFLFALRSEPAISGGRPVYGKAKKVPTDVKYLLDDADFFVWIDAEAWNGWASTQREALIDHVLAACIKTDDGYEIVQPDIQEFSHVLGRRGLWNLSLCIAKDEIIKATQLDFFAAIESVEKTPTGAIITMSADKLAAISG